MSEKMAKKKKKKEERPESEQLVLLGCHSLHYDTEPRSIW